MRYEVRYRSHGQEWGEWGDGIPPESIGLMLDGWHLHHITFVANDGLRWQWRISVHPDVT